MITLCLYQRPGQVLPSVDPMRGVVSPGPSVPPSITKEYKLNLMAATACFIVVFTEIKCKLFQLWYGNRNLPETFTPHSTCYTNVVCLMIDNIGYHSAMQTCADWSNLLADDNNDDLQ